jgi:hypothetical protein
MNKSGEMILAAIQPKGKPKFKKQFKGECRLCRAKGHKAADCWDNDKNKEKHPSNYKKRTPDTSSIFQNPQKKKLKYDYCHKDGHTIEGCCRNKNRDRKQNKDHHVACIAIDGDNGFPLCKEMTSLHKAGKEKHGTFVFDSSATSHM